jgi:hypothetical protein
VLNSDLLQYRCKGCSSSPVFLCQCAANSLTAQDMYPHERLVDFFAKTNITKGYLAIAGNMKLELAAGGCARWCIEVKLFQNGV